MHIKLTVKSTHAHCIAYSQQTKHQNTALIGKPIAQFEPKHIEMIELIHKDDATTKRNPKPNDQIRKNNL